MGGLFSGSKTTKTTQDTSSGPSKFQQPYLDDLFGSAKTNFANSQGTPYYQGDTYAGMDATGKGNLDAIRGYAGGQGANTSATLSQLGGTFAGQAGSAVDTLGQVRQGYAADPTQANITNAGAYAANPYLDGQIDAASRDITRNLYETALPGIDKAGVSSGGMNNSRLGVASGIAQRGAADRIADISSNMRGQAYQNGLSMAEQSRQANLQGLSGVSNAYGNMATNGASALQAGQNSAYQNLNAASAADQTGQADRQGYLTQGLDQWKGNDTRAYDLQKRYQEIVGNQQWGQEGTTTQTQKTPTGGILGGVLGTALGAAGVASGLGWQPFK